MNRLESLYFKKQYQVGFPYPETRAVWLSRKESVSFPTKRTITSESLSANGQQGSAYRRHWSPRSLGLPFPWEQAASVLWGSPSRALPSLAPACSRKPALTCSQELCLGNRHSTLGPPKTLLGAHNKKCFHLFSNLRENMNFPIYCCIC